MFPQPKNYKPPTAAEVKACREWLSAAIGVDLSKVPPGTAIELTEEQARKLVGGK